MEEDTLQSRDIYRFNCRTLLRSSTMRGEGAVHFRTTYAPSRKIRRIDRDNCQYKNRDDHELDRASMFRF